MYYLVALADMLLGIAGLILAAIFPGMLGTATIVGSLAALISGIGFLGLSQQSRRNCD